ncbi:calcium-binding protein [Kordiimonas lacus]|uniref:Hemolysin-type calcium-binding repeat-containing protein n=1 Tax=Kordiimonas lacus TaxID=637679 RepID=A0A1G7BZ17_9PROT|nr:calcium-binding protein [Kordiimonas lacus]SDE32338.1 Hemolysin-type calcium-binding repeat-containing protein [Kordiimonas lacus]
MTSTLRLDYEGTPGGDVLVGGEELSVISGGAGNDVLVGAQGRDRLMGGDGDDILIGGGLRSGNWDVSTDLAESQVIEVAWIEEPHPSFFAEVLVGGNGNDLIFGGSWDDTGDDGEYLYADASAFAELILDGSGELGDGGVDMSGPVGGERFAEGFNNIVWAGEGADTVYGANGFDTIGGGAGDDILYGLGGPDIIYGGDGDDAIYGGNGDPTNFHRLSEGESFTIVQRLFGGEGNDSLIGGDGAELHYGGAGNDKLYGRGGDDTLHGGAGDDWLSGGDGNDTFITGDGADTVYFDFDNSVNTVTDFDVAEDRIVIDNHAWAVLFETGLQNATEETMDGQSGLLIDAEAGALFLVGLTTSDIEDIEVVVFWPD